MVETQMEKGREGIRERETMLGRMIPRNRQVRWTLHVGRLPNHRWWSSISNDETANGPVISSRNYHDSRDQKEEEKGRKRERSVLPLTSICKEGEEGRREGKKMMVENLSNIFCLCLSVIYTLHEA